MESWGMVLVEIFFFTGLIAFLMRKKKKQYKVSKDIWGLYEQPTIAGGESRPPMVIVFSSETTRVNVESPENVFNLERRRTHRNHRDAA